MSTKRTHRPRVLLIEDEAFIAVDLALTLQSEGYEVLGPCRTSEEAREAILKLHPDVALLDIKLGKDASSFELGKLLDAADIPYLFISGFSEKIVPLPEELADRPRLGKPVDIGQLKGEIERLIDEEGMADRLDATIDAARMT